MKHMDAGIIHRSGRGELVSIDGARASRNETIETKWQRFVEAQQRSKHTLSVADGIAAGKAYADFLETFSGRR